MLPDPLSVRYNLPWLLERYQRGEPLQYVFFWGHQPNRDGSISHSCFSQWWPSAFNVGDTRYATAEHWMMAEKARLFNDATAIEKILACRTPAEAKKLGRTVQHFNPVTWDTHKYAIVKMGTFHKFSQHPTLKEYLLSTREKVLVEASPDDNVWGIGMAKSHADIENPTRWQGLNLLGFALMEVRDALKPPVSSHQPDA
jgi:ribA/ribD-fused uncharacterized protein